MKKFENKSLRLKDYDYSLSGGYFITIGINDRNHLFGEIENEKIILNDLGIIADTCWKEIPDHFDNVEIDEYCIMPNHIHGIINYYGTDAECDTDSVIQKEIVGQTHAFDLSKKKHQKIPVIIGSFKSAVTKEINKFKSEANFKWQSSYHDRIIRNEKELKKIRQYIIDNPKNWDEDIENKLFRENISEKDLKTISGKLYKNL